MKNTGYHCEHTTLLYSSDTQISTCQRSTQTSQRLVHTAPKNTKAEKYGWKRVKRRTNNIKRLTPQHTRYKCLQWGRLKRTWGEQLNELRPWQPLRVFKHIQDRYLNAYTNTLWDSIAKVNSEDCAILSGVSHFYQLLNVPGEAQRTIS